MPLFDTECLKTDTKYSYSEILKGSCTLLKGVVSTDLEWLSEIFNGRKHRAVSL